MKALLLLLVVVLAAAAASEGVSEQPGGRRGVRAVLLAGAGAGAPGVAGPAPHPGGPRRAAGLRGHRHAVLQAHIAAAHAAAAAPGGGHRGDGAAQRRGGAAGRQRHRARRLLPRQAAAPQDARRAARGRQQPPAPRVPRGHGLPLPHGGGQQGPGHPGRRPGGRPGEAGAGGGRAAARRPGEPQGCQEAGGGHSVWPGARRPRYTPPGRQRGSNRDRLRPGGGGAAGRGRGHERVARGAARRQRARQLGARAAAAPAVGPHPGAALLAGGHYLTATISSLAPVERLRGRDSGELVRSRATAAGFRPRNTTRPQNPSPAAPRTLQPSAQPPSPTDQKLQNIFQLKTTFAFGTARSVSS